MNFRFNPLLCDSQGALIRRFPLGGLEDTVCFDDNNLTVSYTNSSTRDLFQDSEILQVDLHPDQYHPPHFGKTQDGRTVIQQRGWRGCGAACESMLRADHGIAPDEDWLNNCNLTDIKTISQSLERGGLRVKKTELFESDTTARGRFLEERLLIGGALIMGIGSEIGGTALSSTPSRWLTASQSSGTQAFLKRMDVDFIQVSTPSRLSKMANSVSRFFSFLRPSR